MLRQFGRLIWRQPREISVLNYPQAIIYEIYTSHGYLHIAHDKTTNKIEVVNGVATRCEGIENSNPANYKTAEELIPHLK